MDNLLINRQKILHYLNTKNLTGDVRKKFQEKLEEINKSIEEKNKSIEEKKNIFFGNFISHLFRRKQYISESTNDLDLFFYEEYLLNDKILLKFFTNKGYDVNIDNMVEIINSEKQIYNEGTENEYVTLANDNENHIKQVKEEEILTLQGQEEGIHVIPNYNNIYLQEALTEFKENVKKIMDDENIDLFIKYDKVDLGYINTNKKLFLDFLNKNMKQYIQGTGNSFTEYTIFYPLFHKIFKKFMELNVEKFTFLDYIYNIQLQTALVIYPNILEKNIILYYYLNGGIFENLQNYYPNLLESFYEILIKNLYSPITTEKLQEYFNDTKNTYFMNVKNEYQISLFPLCIDFYNENKNKKDRSLIDSIGSITKLVESIITEKFTQFKRDTNKKYQSGTNPVFKENDELVYIENNLEFFDTIFKNYIGNRFFISDEIMREPFTTLSFINIIREKRGLQLLTKNQVKDKQEDRVNERKRYLQELFSPDNFQKKTIDELKNQKVFIQQQKWLKKIDERIEQLQRLKQQKRLKQEQRIRQEQRLKQQKRLKQEQRIRQEQRLKQQKRLQQERRLQQEQEKYITELFHGLLFPYSTWYINNEQLQKDIQNITITILKTIGEITFNNKEDWKIVLKGTRALQFYSDGFRTMDTDIILINGDDQVISNIMEKILNELNKIQFLSTKKSSFERKMNDEQNTEKIVWKNDSNEFGLNILDCFFKYSEEIKQKYYSSYVLKENLDLKLSFYIQSLEEMKKEYNNYKVKYELLRNKTEYMIGYNNFLKQKELEDNLQNSTYYSNNLLGREQKQRMINELRPINFFIDKFTKKLEQIKKLQQKNTNKQTGN
jgi:hypothetical protein